MAQGKGAFYQRLQPSKLDVGKSLLDHENQQFKHREEERLVQDREDAEKKRRFDEREAAIGSIKSFDSGRDGVNAALTSVAKDTIDEMGDLFDKNKDKELNEWSTEDLIKKSSLSRYFDDLKKMNVEGLSMLKGYDTALKNGEVWNNPMLDNFGSKGRIGFGRNSAGEPTVLKYDEDGNVAFHGTLNELIGEAEIIEKIDKKTFSKGVLGGIEDYKNTEETRIYGGGGLKTSTKKRLEAIKEKVGSTPDSVIKSFMRGEDIEITPEAIKTYKDNYINELYLQGDQGSTIGKGNKDAVPSGGGGGKTEGGIGGLSMHSSDNKTVVYKRGEKIGNIDLKKNTVGFAISTPKGTKSNVQSLIDGKKDVYNSDHVYVDEDGTVYIEGVSEKLIPLDEGNGFKTNEDGKYITENTNTVFRSDDKNQENIKKMNQVARSLGFSNVKDMSARLRAAAGNIFEENRSVETQDSNYNYENEIYNPSMVDKNAASRWNKK